MMAGGALDFGQLHGRVALVTGASRGIGRATAEALAQAGASVAVHCRASVESAQELAGALSVGGRTARHYVSDFTDPGACARLVDAVYADFGRIDILVNNAGIVAVRDIATTSLSDWQRTIAVNLTAAFLVTQGVVSIMREQGRGVIVNVASVAGVNGGYMGPAYAASKGGLIALTRYLARDCIRSGIRVNCVAPTLTDTDLLRQPEMEPLRVRILSLNPIGRVARPAEVAAVICFLCSDAASYINGDCIMVTGGP